MPILVVLQYNDLPECEMPGSIGMHPFFKANPVALPMLDSACVQAGSFDDIDALNNGQLVAMTALMHIWAGVRDFGGLPRTFNRTFNVLGNSA